MTDDANQLPLTGVRVLDLCRARAGPTCVRQLADWGADVIKIEMPLEDGDNDGMGGARSGPDFQNLHRNKRSITLNLKQAEGVDLFKRLAERADVIVENFRPGVKHRLKVGPEEMLAVNPRLIYASLSGFGQTGPYKDRPGLDQIAQGMGGLMSITGLPGRGPLRIGVPVCDLSSGIFLAQGVLVALLEREVTGEGKWIHTSLLEAMISQLDFQGSRWLIGKEVPPQAGNEHPTGMPTGVVATRDGHINIAAAGNVLFERMCKAIGATDLLEDGRFKTGPERRTHRVALMQLLAPRFLERDSADWVALLNESGVPCGPIYRIDEVFQNEQVKHLGIAETIHSAQLGKDITIIGQPITMSRTPTRIRSATPAMGEHNAEVYGAIGLGAADLERLKQQKVI